MLAQLDIEDFIHLRMPEEQVKSYLQALTPESIEAPLFCDLLTAMRQTVIPLPKMAQPVLDCCGTGGSGLPHFNTSTTVAFILAAGGVPVVKFGNRAMSSASGSFDFLEAIGLSVELPLAEVSGILEETGLVFLFAPQCYPALAAFSKFRRSLGIKTVFNYMGPLLNPMAPSYRVLGVSHPKMQVIIANILSQESQNIHSWVFRGEDSLDELSIVGPNSVLEVKSNLVEPKTLHLPVTNDILLDNESYDAVTNAKIFQQLLQGELADSPSFKMVCLNAAAGFVVYGKATDLAEGIALSESLLREKQVLKKFDACRRVYARLAA